jgi:5-methylthioadenosine/S-adenosylhomocysteine deaminase
VTTRFFAARVLPDSSKEFAPGCVVCDGERITWVGLADEAPQADTTVDLDDVVLTPGLVNAHCHMDLMHLRGQVPVREHFAEWLESVARARHGPDKKAAALWGVKEALSRGTTTFGDIVPTQSFDDMVGVFAETRARARVYVEAIGFQPEKADEVFERVWELVEMQTLPPTVQTGVSPHAPYSVSLPLLQQLIAMAEGHGRPVAIHVGETLEELAFLRHGIGPLRELHKRFDADDPGHKPYGSLPEFLKEIEVDKARLALVHGNYMRPRDVPGGAFIVYCPSAHKFFGHPEHAVIELLEEGVRVALGSDSAAAGDSVDILSETQLLGRTRTDIDPRPIFQMATEWGAAALDLDSGRLEPGRLADLAAFTPALSHEILAHQEARCVLTVVGGEILHTAEQEPAS